MTVGAANNLHSLLFSSWRFMFASLNRRWEFIPWREQSRTLGFSGLIGYEEDGFKRELSCSAAGFGWQQRTDMGSPTCNLFCDPRPGFFLWKHTYMNRHVDTCTQVRTHMHPPTWTEITRLRGKASQVFVNRHWTGQPQQALSGLFFQRYLPIYPWHRERLPAIKPHSTPRTEIVFLLLNHKGFW